MALRLVLALLNLESVHHCVVAPERQAEIAVPNWEPEDGFATGARIALNQTAMFQGCMAHHPLGPQGAGSWRCNWLMLRSSMYTHSGPQGVGSRRCSWVLLRSDIYMPTAARKEPDEHQQYILLCL